MNIQLFRHGALVGLLLGWMASPAYSSPQYQWFWNMVPPRMADGERSRAMDALAAARLENRRTFGNRGMARAVMSTCAFLAWSCQMSTCCMVEPAA